MIKEFRTFEGFALERYFRAKFIEEKRYTAMAGWWDRKGENEVDLVCEDEPSGAIDFYEIKCNPKAIDLGVLKEKSERFFEKHPEKRTAAVRLKGLSPTEM